MVRRQTYDLIEKYHPMIPQGLLDNFEKKEGFLKFDVMVKQQDDESTVWGKRKTGN